MPRRVAGMAAKAGSTVVHGATVEGGAAVHRRGRRPGVGGVSTAIDGRALLVPS